MATLVTITITVDNGGSPALTADDATSIVANVIKVLEPNTLAPTYSSAAVALAVT